MKLFHLERYNWKRIFLKCPKAFVNFKWLFRYVRLLLLKENGSLMFWYLCHIWIAHSSGEFILSWFCLLYTMNNHILTHLYLYFIGQWLINTVFQYMLSLDSEKRRNYIISSNIWCKTFSNLHSSLYWLNTYGSLNKSFLISEICS